MQKGPAIKVSHCSTFLIQALLHNLFVLHHWMEPTKRCVIYGWSVTLVAERTREARLSTSVAPCVEHSQSLESRLMDCLKAGRSCPLILCELPLNQH
jgi:hypothetical protein